MTSRSQDSRSRPSQPDGAGGPSAGPAGRPARGGGVGRGPGDWRRNVWRPALLVALSVGLFLLNAGQLPLADPEESRCGLIVHEMLAGGDWLLPHLEGRPYYDKPAPFFWLAALGQRLTGSVELGGRLVAALAGLGAVLVTYAWAAALWGPTAGLLAGAMLATSGEFLFLARWYRMDMPFTAAMWAALWWFWRCQRRRPGGAAPARAPTAAWLGFYAFTAVATLFKGPAGLALPAIIVLAYFLLGRQYRAILGFFRPAGVCLYLLVALPWYLVVALRHGDFAYEFIVRHNLLRFAGGGNFGHTWPGVLYVPILLAGLLPWTIFLPGAVIRYFPRRWRDRDGSPAVLLLWLAALVPLVFFSFSRTKLSSYILPVFPPLSVLMAGLVAGWVNSAKPDRLMAHGARALWIMVLLLPLVPAGLEVWLGAAGPWLAVPVGVSVLAAAAMRRSLRRDRRGGFVAWAVAAVVGTFLYLIAHSAPVGYERMSTRTLARLVPDPTGVQVCFWPARKFSFVLYTGARQTETFHRSSPDGLRALARLMGSSRRVYCLVSGRGQLEGLRRACPGLVHVVAGKGRSWLVSNRIGPVGQEAPARLDRPPDSRPGSRPGTNKLAGGATPADSGAV